ncbi:MAG: hypothetical protein KGH66_03500 [Candidatus Micrarchaeota archaeon]|nr:hypothetical protein [Candidatus Micrarchaeota archaeon]
MDYIMVDTSSILFGMSYRKSALEAVKTKFPGLKPLVSKGIISELNKLSLNKGKKGAAAKAALAEITLKKIDVEGVTGYADSWILARAARFEGSVVVTNDTELARKLMNLHASVFKMSKNGFLSRFNLAESNK